MCKMGVWNMPVHVPDSSYHWPSSSLNRTSPKIATSFRTPGGYGPFIQAISPLQISILNQEACHPSTRCCFFVGNERANIINAKQNVKLYASNFDQKWYSARMHQPSKRSSGTHMIDESYLFRLHSYSCLLLLSCSVPIVLSGIAW